MISTSTAGPMADVTRARITSVLIWKSEFKHHEWRPRTSSIDIHLRWHAQRISRDSSDVLASVPFNTPHISEFKRMRMSAFVRLPSI
jgi:hypothetical protein